ncbi:MAG TPA: erythromycin esterase family protein, partial [Thermomicrobiales bacterium]
MDTQPHAAPNEVCEGGYGDDRYRDDAVAHLDGRVAEDEYFYAEEYSRTMFHAYVSSWNLRDRHMTDTLDALLAHLDQHGGQTKVVVWAHNSHLGDARATQMGEAGGFNVGQLFRERHGSEAALIGLTTHHGT